METDDRRAHAERGDRGMGGVGVGGYGGVGGGCGGLRAEDVLAGLLRHAALTVDVAEEGVRLDADAWNIRCLGAIVMQSATLHRKFSGSSSPERRVRDARLAQAALGRRRGLWPG